jgi:hypothetical protein
MLRMRAVHMHVADIVIVCVKDRDFVLLLQHLHADVPKHEGHAAGPALVAGRGIGNLFLGKFAVLLHHLGRLGFQNRVGEVAHQLGNVAHAVGARAGRSRSIVGRQCPGCFDGHARKVSHRPRTAQWRLDIGKSEVGPYAGEIGDRRCTLTRLLRERRR